MKVLMIYAKDEYTTARYFENVIRASKGHQFLGAGLTKQYLASVVGDQHWIQLGQEVVITDFLSKLPAKPEVIISMQGFAPMKIYGLESCGIPSLYYGIDTHMIKDFLFEEGKNYTKVFFAQKKAIPEFKEYCGKDATWLPCAAEPLIHKPMDFKEEYDFAFVGGVDLSEAHKPRREAIKKLRSKYKVFVGNAYGYHMSKVYAKTKVVFNYAVNDDLNMRFFEAMSCKKTLLSNKLSPETGVDELFEDGKHYLSFTDSDLMEKAEKIIKDNDFRKKIAEEGYKEVLSKHTYSHRMEDIWTSLKT